LFKTKCSSCHTFGKGERIGPDLKGVTERRSREWLIAWIRSSETVIRSGDPTAVALFREFRQQRMPEHPLSDVELGALVDYLAASGPEADEQKAIRRAHQASAEDVRLGERLFFGRAPLSGNGLACAACHALATRTGLGGTLAADLSTAFSRYHDTALDQMLTRAGPSRSPLLHSTSVTDQESLALRAFLRAVSLASQPGVSGVVPRDTAAAPRP
jgi:mono/diheme cytochrome c family protein